MPKGKVTPAILTTSERHDLLLRKARDQHYPIKEDIFNYKEEHQGFTTIGDDVIDYLRSLIEQGLKLKKSRTKEDEKLAAESEKLIALRTKAGSDKKYTDRLRTASRKIAEERKAVTKKREREDRSLGYDTMYSLLLLLSGEDSPEFRVVSQLGTKKPQEVLAKLPQSELSNSIKRRYQEISKKDLSEKDAMMLAAIRALIAKIKQSQSPDNFLDLCRIFVDEVGEAVDHAAGFPIRSEINNIRIDVLKEELKSETLDQDTRRRKAKELISIAGHFSTGGKYTDLLLELRDKAAKDGDAEIFLKVNQYIIDASYNYGLRQPLGDAIKNLHDEFLEKLFTPDQGQPLVLSIYDLEYLLRDAIELPREKDQPKRARIIESLASAYVKNDQKPQIPADLFKLAAEMGDQETLTFLASLSAQEMHFPLSGSYGDSGYKTENLLTLLLNQYPAVKIEIFRTLIKTLPELLEIREGELSAVEAAILKGRTDFIDLLKNLQKPINPRPTLLSQAVIASNVGACTFLAEHFPDFVDQRLTYKTGLTLSLGYGHHYTLPFAANSSLSALEVAAFKLALPRYRDDDEATIFLALATKDREIKAKTEGGLNPLQAVIRGNGGSHKAIEALCKCYPKMALEKDANGHNAIYYAVNKSNPTALKIMMEGLSDEELLNALQGTSYALDGNNILHNTIAMRDNAVFVASLIARFPNLLFTSNNAGVTPLDLAIRCDIKCIAHILSVTPVEKFLEVEYNVVAAAFDLVETTHQGFYYHRESRDYNVAAKHVLEFFRTQHPAKYLELLSRRNADDISCIDRMIKSGNVAFLEECRVLGLDLSKLPRNTRGENALHIALRESPSNHDLLKYLIKEYPALLEETDSAGLRPRDYALCSAIKNNDINLLQIIPPQTKGVAAFSGETPIAMLGLKGEPGENIARVVLKEMKGTTYVPFLVLLLRENPELAKVRDEEKRSLLEDVIARENSYGDHERYNEVITICCRSNPAFPLSQVKEIVLQAILKDKLSVVEILLEAYPKSADINLFRQVFSSNGRRFYHDEQTRRVLLAMIARDDGSLLRDLIMSNARGDLSLLHYYTSNKELGDIVGGPVANPLVFALKNNNLSAANFLMEKYPSLHQNLDQEQVEEFLPNLLSSEDVNFVSDLISRLNPAIQATLTGERNYFLRLARTDIGLAKTVADLCPTLVENISDEEVYEVLPAILSQSSRRNVTSLMVKLIKNRGDSLKLENDSNPLCLALQGGRNLDAKLLFTECPFLLSTIDIKTSRNLLVAIKDDFQLTLTALSIQPELVDLTGAANPLLGLLKSRKFDEFQKALITHPQLFKELGKDALTEVVGILGDLKEFELRYLLPLVLQNSNHKNLTQLILDTDGCGPFVELMLAKDMPDFLLDLQECIRDDDAALKKLKSVITTNHGAILQKIQENVNDYKCPMTLDIIDNPILVKTASGFRYYEYNDHIKTLDQDPTTRQPITKRDDSPEAKEIFFKNFNLYQDRLTYALRVHLEGDKTKSLEKEFVEEIRDYLREKTQKSDKETTIETLVARALGLVVDDSAPKGDVTCHADALQLASTPIRQVTLVTTQ